MICLRLLLKLTRLQTREASLSYNLHVEVETILVSPP